MSSGEERNKERTHDLSQRIYGYLKNDDDNIHLKICVWVGKRKKNKEWTAAARENH